MIIKKRKNSNPSLNFYAGSIHYTELGQMSVLVRFAEKPAALDEVVGYSGTYQVDGNQIIHHVTTSVRPEYEGQTLIRTFRLENDELVTEFENTDEFIKFARWKRL